MKIHHILLPIFALSACSEAPAPADNALLAGDGPPIASRTVMTGSEGATVPACPSLSQVKPGGTDVYWAPDEVRAVKAKLGGGERIALCEATADDRWFGIVFAAPGLDIDVCGIGRAVPNPREYQGPCRWGWIKGGTVQLGQ